MAILRFFLITLFFLGWLPGKAWALPDEPPSTMELQSDLSYPAAPPENYGPAFLKMIAALIGLLAIIFIVMWLIKGIARGKFSRQADAPHITVIERRPLSPKSMLYLIEVDGVRVLLAESQLEVRPLYQSMVTEEKLTS